MGEFPFLIIVLNFALFSTLLTSYLGYKLYFQQKVFRTQQVFANPFYIKTRTKEAISFRKIILVLIFANLILLFTYPLFSEDTFMLGMVLGVIILYPLRVLISNLSHIHQLLAAKKRVIRGNLEIPLWYNAQAQAVVNASFGVLYSLFYLFISSPITASVLLGGAITCWTAALLSIIYSVFLKHRKTT